MVRGARIGNARVARRMVGENRKEHLKDSAVSRAEPAINISRSFLLVSFQCCPRFSFLPLQPLRFIFSLSLFGYFLPFFFSHRAIRWSIHLIVIPTGYCEDSRGEATEMKAPTLFEEKGDGMIDTADWLLPGFLATQWQGFPHAHHHRSLCNWKYFLPRNN